MPSTVIQFIDYNDDAQTLKVVFQSGMVYKYYDFPPDIFVDFKKSSSKGVFLNTKIKGNYKFNKIK